MLHFADYEMKRRTKMSKNSVNAKERMQVFSCGAAVISATSAEPTPLDRVVNAAKVAWNNWSGKKAA